MNEELDEIVDKTRPVIFSAHGVPKSIPLEANSYKMEYIDATCPLVSKVHREAENLNKIGYHIVLIGHINHPEVIGTMGQLPKGSIDLIQNEKDVEEYTLKVGKKIAYVTQTTLSVDDTKNIVNELKKRFENIIGPHKEDICYATTNRQKAVKEIAPDIDALLVIGAPNSSNSKRLVEVGKFSGCKYSQLVQRAIDIDWRSLRGIKSVGITAGASAPEILINEVIDAFAERYEVHKKFVETAIENVSFKVPRILREQKYD